MASAHPEEVLKKAFDRAFGAPAPTHFVRAPGRVNLIGEHTDYNGLPVLPMAIERSVTVAIRARSDARVRLANVDPAFGLREFEIGESIEPYSRGDWGNYAKAAARALCGRSAIARGFDGVVHGDIPQAAGLSSSSALVVACALALVDVNDLDVTREELMELTARGERFVGTESGGMDQAICLGAKRGYAALIRFDPLQLEHVPIPSDWCFVIADSGVEAKKSGAAQTAYNARVTECRAALGTLVRHPLARNWPTNYAALLGNVSAGELSAVADEALDGTLRARFRHVVSEGRRVEQARDALLKKDMPRFGELMNASHESLHVDYEVSCRELDELVAVAREFGAAGARLTGAGFGGCVVILVQRTEADELVAHLNQARGSSPRGPARGATIWVANSADGACVEGNNDA